MKIEQQRREIMICMAEQDFLDLEYYDKEIERLQLTYPPIFFHILEGIIHKFIVDYIDKVIEDLKENEK